MNSKNKTNFDQIGFKIRIVMTLFEYSNSFSPGKSATKSNFDSVLYQFGKTRPVWTLFQDFQKLLLRLVIPLEKFHFSKIFIWNNDNCSSTSPLVLLSKHWLVKHFSMWPELLKNSVLKMSKVQLCCQISRLNYLGKG